MKVLLRSPLSTYSGYGNDGLGIIQALLRRGCDVYLQPTHIDAPVPQNVANLLTKELKAPFDLYLTHTDPMIMNCQDEIVPHVGVSVGWSMWEFSNYGNMAKSSRETLRERMKNFDMFVGYSDIDPDCMRPYYDGPIVVQQGGFDPSQWGPIIDRDWDCREFYMFMIGVLSERKDPFRAIEAFRLARSQDPEFWRWARLSLKTTAPGLHHKIEDLFRDTDPETSQEFSSLRVFYDIWPTKLVQEFYKVQHVLLAPSRGEGKNMPALEFMSTGGAVIATNWAGHVQWLNPEYSYPLGYTLEPVSEKYRKTLNARASVEHLAELMLHTFHNRAEVRQKGRLASEVIPKSHSWDMAIDKLFMKIRDTLPEKGERFWTLAELAKERVNADS